MKITTLIRAISSFKYNSECTIDPSKISIVAIDKTIKGTNKNGEIIRHFVISPFPLKLVTKALFYNITNEQYDLPQLENGTDKWTPDLFVGANSADTDIRFRYGCVKFVSELKVFKHAKENGKFVKMLDSAKAEETININSANIADNIDNFRIDPKIVGAKSFSSNSLRHENIFCPSNTETVGSKEFTAEFQDLKSNKIALNVIDAKMPILKMLFENRQTNCT